MAFWEGISPGVREAIAQACRIAYDRGSRTVDVADMAAALDAPPAPDASVPAEVREREMAFSEAAKRVIAEAFEHARGRDETTVDVAHLTKAVRDAGGAG